ncbi:MAG: histidine--tRNA ligase [Candidatus Rokubacteria bacterium]|nr:histidine--tRNA ligase [Candidatus Rokubacteria bacterium]
MSETGRKKRAKISTEPPRGMRDILPDEAELRDATGQTILAVYRRYGFRRIETPALESIQLLTRGEGGENEKLIFKVLKRGEKLDLAGAVSEADLVDLGLRFDLTVPLARYYAHNHARLPKPLKAVQVGPVWRAERPQKGRYRQFTQCDIDILGVESSIAEIELILATTEALAALGLEELTVRINDRRILNVVAERCGFDPARYDSILIAVDKLDKVGKAKVLEELSQAGHPAEAIAHLMDLLSVESDPDRGLEWMRKRLEHERDDGAFEALARIIGTVRGEAAGRFGIAFDPALVRGMSYYTGPIFEIASSRFPSSIAGGGRYDELIGKILGQDVPATGFSIGFERVVSILTERAGGRGRRRERVAMIFDEAAPDLRPVLEKARELRSKGLAVSLEIRAKRRGAQLAALAAQGFDGYVWFDGSESPVHWFDEDERRFETGDEG